MKFINFDDNDVLAARYDSELHGDNIPADALEVSDAVFWQTINENDGVWKIGRDTGEIYKAQLPEPEPYIPDSITMRQCRLELHSQGVLASVQPAIDALEEPSKTEAQIEWDYAQTVNRDNPVMQMLAAAMELDGGQLDQMFVAAAQR